MIEDPGAGAHEPRGTYTSSASGWPIVRASRTLIHYSFILLAVHHYSYWSNLCYNESKLSVSNFRSIPSLPTRLASTPELNAMLRTRAKNRALLNVRQEFKQTVDPCLSKNNQKVNACNDAVPYLAAESLTRLKTAAPRTP